MAVSQPARVTPLVLACTSSGGAGRSSYLLHTRPDLAELMDLIDTRPEVAAAPATPISGGEVPREPAFERQPGVGRARRVGLAPVTAPTLVVREVRRPRTARERSGHRRPDPRRPARDLRRRARVPLPGSPGLADHPRLPHRTVSSRTSTRAMAIAAAKGALPRPVAATTASPATTANATAVHRPGAPAGPSAAVTDAATSRPGRDQPGRGATETVGKSAHPGARRRRRSREVGVEEVRGHTERRRARRHPDRVASGREGRPASPRRAGSRRRRRRAATTTACARSPGCRRARWPRRARGAPRHCASRRAGIVTMAATRGRRRAPGGPPGVWTSPWARGLSSWPTCRSRSASSRSLPHSMVSCPANTAAVTTAARYAGRSCPTASSSTTHVTASDGPRWAARASGSIRSWPRRTTAPVNPVAPPRSLAPWVEHGWIPPWPTTPTSSWGSTSAGWRASCRRTPSPSRASRPRRRRSSRTGWDYVAVVGDEHTQRGNVAAFERWGIVPRMPSGAAERDLGVELFGHALPTTGLPGPHRGARRDDRRRARRPRYRGGVGVLRRADGGVDADAGPDGRGRRRPRRDPRLLPALHAEQPRAGRELRGVAPRPPVMRGSSSPSIS